MITDFPALPLPLPRPHDVAAELAAFGGEAMVPEGFRRTIFPVITKEDVFGMLIAQRVAPE